MSLDRTREFFSLVSEFGGVVNNNYNSAASPLSAVATAAAKGYYGNRTDIVGGTGGRSSSSSGNTNANTNISNASTFTRAAGEVSRDLNITAKRISELTQCAYNIYIVSSPFSPPLK